MLFVQGQDGQFYIDPIFHGKNWALKCDDDDGCEIRVKSYPKTVVDSARKRALRCLKDKGVKAKVIEYQGEEDSLLAPKFDTLMSTVCFKLQLTAPIPVPDTFAEVVSAPALEHPFLAWSMTFDRSAIESIKSGSMHKLLVKYLTGKMYVKENERKDILKKLKKLIPKGELPERVTLDYASTVTL